MLKQETRLRRRDTSTLCLALATSFAAIALCAGEASAVTYINGYDVYSGDGTVDFYTSAINGYQFAFVKATEGTNFVDINFTTNFTKARDVNDPAKHATLPANSFYVGPYHLARPDSKNGVAWQGYDGLSFAYNATAFTNREAWWDATREADDFIDAIKPYYYQTGVDAHFLPPVADIELSKIPNFGSNTKAFISNWVQQFSDTVKDALGVRPLMYLSQSNAATNYTTTIESEHKLWIAWYKGTGTTSPPTTSDTPGWPPWSFWQWSNGTDSIAQSSPVPGTSGNIDRDVFSGTTAQLAALKVQIQPGDYNHNGYVDAADYVAWRMEQASTDVLKQYVAAHPSETYASPYLAADGNNTGNSKDIVDAADYTYWRSQFGRVLNLAGSGASDDMSGVPEPTAAVLLVWGWVLFVAGCGRRSAY